MMLAVPPRRSMLNDCSAVAARPMASNACCTPPPVISMTCLTASPPPASTKSVAPKGLASSSLRRRHVDRRSIRPAPAIAAPLTPRGRRRRSRSRPRCRPGGRWRCGTPRRRRSSPRSRSARRGPAACPCGSPRRRARGSASARRRTTRCRNCAIGRRGGVSRGSLVGRAGSARSSTQQRQVAGQAVLAVAAEGRRGR